ncbi:MAG TPA: hypothetical protein PLB55_03815 [Prosthecobacter sp.]|nr:hypothetical protein [Prosthecobacter sp.]
MNCLISPSLFASLRVVSAVMTLCFASGCMSTDPEFKQGSTTKNKNFGGNEIVGKWYARSDHKGVLAGKGHNIMELYANGTGQARADGDLSAFMSGKLTHKSPPTPITWRYKGAGVWSFRQEGQIDKFGNRGSPFIGTMSLSEGRLFKNSKLIVPTIPIMGWGLMGNKEIYVRSNDMNAVRDEQLRDNLSR